VAAPNVPVPFRGADAGAQWYSRSFRGGLLGLWFTQARLAAARRVEADPNVPVPFRGADAGAQWYSQWFRGGLLGSIFTWARLAAARSSVRCPLLLPEDPKPN
jgi:hypothetical protein